MSDELKRTDQTVLKKIIDNLGGALGGGVGRETQDLMISNNHIAQEFKQMAEKAKIGVGGLLGGVVGQAIQNTIIGGTHVTEHGTPSATPGNPISKSDNVRKL